jgi:hypothetical protein
LVLNRRKSADFGPKVAVMQQGQNVQDLQLRTKKNFKSLNIPGEMLNFSLEKIVIKNGLKG